MPAVATWSTGDSAGASAAEYTAAPADLTADFPDSIWGVTEPIVVIGTTTSRTADPSGATLDAIALSARDLKSAADLGPVLPATRVLVNSRGESQFMIRGAPERQVRLWLDGIPLNVPWDERVDASLVPVDAVGSVRAVRGVGSALDGPNALAGTIELRSPLLPGDGRRTRLGFQMGESHLWEGRLLHQRRSGDWEMLAASAWRRQSGFVVPDGLAAPFNQGSARERLNSDLEQASLLLRLRRDLQGGGAWHLLLLGTDGEKGVPPETHLEDGARYWRNPAVRRGLLGIGLSKPLGEDDRWELRADIAGDLFRQEIRAYDDATYTTPALAPGSDYETDDDATGYARVRATRRLSEESTLAVQAMTRYAHHRESLERDGPTLDYAQLIASLTAEADIAVGDQWRLLAGGGYDRASTPETGDKPARDATGAAVAHLRVQRQVGERAVVHGSLSRRSRFPALRELYSGALGRFVPNPDLAPERQDQIETGLTARGATWEVGLTGFASYLDGGIERISLPGRQFQRVNLDAIRTLGLEAVVAWRPLAAWEVGAHHTILDSRRKKDGRYGEWAEDRPAYMWFVSMAWAAPWGSRLAVEGTALGPRMSADAADEVDGLRRLPAQGAMNVRLSQPLREGIGPLTRAEIYARVNNVLDAEIDAQSGLPEPGRTLLIGVNAWLDAWRTR